MGTRALIHVKDEGKTVVTIYRHYDGSPLHLGRDILNVIGDNSISNGIQERAFNGMGCFAAMLIKELKKDIGNVYIYKPNTRDVGEEFVYTITQRDGKIDVHTQEVY